MHICWTLGEFKPLEDVSISLTDLGLRRSYGLFDFLRTYNKRPFQRDYHVEKFLKSAEEMNLGLTISKEEIEDVIEALAERAEGDVGITLMGTAGPSPDLFTPAGASRLFIFTSALPKKSDSSLHTITFDYERPMPKLKSFNYFPAIMHLMACSDPLVKEVIYRNRAGELLEATRSNLFAIKNGKLITPNEGILHGATRAIVLEIAPKVGLSEIEYRAIHEEELPHLDALFITSTLREITPISKVNELTVPIHPQVYALKEVFDQYTGKKDAAAKI